MGERYAGGAMDLVNSYSREERNSGRKVTWPSSSEAATGLDMFERNLESFLRNPTIEGSITASSFSTAEDGRRVEILADSSSRVRFYSGRSDETDNGVISSQDAGDGRDFAVWTPGEYDGDGGSPAGTYRAMFLLYGRTESLTSLFSGFADAWSFNAASTGVYQFNAAPVRVADGSASVPSLSFYDDTDTGFYRLSTNALGWTGAGTFGGFLHAGGVRTVDGTAGVPAYSFSSDSDTGMYRAGTNTIGFTSGGTLVSQWGSGFGTALTVMNTTGSAANVHATGSNILQKVTSSARFKKNQRQIRLDEARKLYSTRPITWYSAADGDVRGDRLGPYAGWTAEDMYTNGPRTLTTMESGVPVSVQYDRVPAHQQVLLNDHEARIADLEALVERLLVQ